MAYPNSTTHRREITVDNTGGAAATNYPVLIALSSANFDFANAQSDGADVRVTADDGDTLLSHWIEFWDADAEVARVWVKIPSLPSNDSMAVYLYYGNASAVTSSAGADVFPLFDDFTGGAARHHLTGSDTADACAYVPEQRRIYFFGQDQAASTGSSVVQWLDIDTDEAGFLWPGLTTAVNAAAVAYSPVTQKIYIFGGKLCSTGALSNKIQTLNPFTSVFATLAAVMPAAIAQAEPAYDPVSGKIFLFGGSIGASTRTNQILVFNPADDTIVDTTADLPTAAVSVGAVYDAGQLKIYLFGGVWENGGTTDNLNTILAYNPATPSVNPVDTTATLAEPTENQHGCSVNGTIYMFGGYRRTTSTYKNIIQKFVPATGIRSTVTATMPRADDDARAFYDSVTDRVYISAWLHSSQASDNAYHEKVILHVFNPNDETVLAEPTIRTGPPTGWTSSGTNPRPPYHIGSYMVLDDDATDSSMLVKKSVSPVLSAGVWMLEVKASLMHITGRFFMVYYQGTTAITTIVDETATQWQIRDGSSVFTTIALIGTGWQVIGTLLDVPNARQYGLVDRASQTAAKTLRAAITTGVNFIGFTTSTADKEKAAIDWVLIRPSRITAEPAQTVGVEVSLPFSTNNAMNCYQTTGAHVVPCYVTTLGPNIVPAREIAAGPNVVPIEIVAAGPNIVPIAFVQ